jgi:hypothetical protein
VVSASIFPKSRRSRSLHAVMLTVVALSALFDVSLARAADNELPASDALPGIYRVGIASAAPPAVAATLGYGYTEPQGAGDGAHHRFSLRAAAALPVVSWLSVGPVIDARYDVHRDDSGAVVDPALQARAVTTVGAWQLGGELYTWLPGAENFSTMLRGTSLDIRGLFATTAGRVRIASQVGYRLDNTAETARDAATLSHGDRFALGVSDFDSVLLGVGAGVPVGDTELLAEASANVLVGRGAPSFRQSPLRLAAGARRGVARNLSLELLAVASLSAKPDLSPGAPLVPNEPRFSLFAGVRYAFLPPPEKPAPPHEQAPVVAPVPRAATDAPLEVVVTDEHGAPVPAPSAFVTVGGVRGELACDETAHCRNEHVSPGEASVHVEAAGFEPAEGAISVKAGVPATLAMTLLAVPPSQVRGVVRSLDGNALPARVRVEPAGTEATVDANGAFALDLPPGSYDVVIEAPGYNAQRRHVQIEAQGVVILNVELTKKSR